MPEQTANPNPPVFVQAGPQINLATVLVVGIVAAMSSILSSGALVAALIYFGGLGPGPAPRPIPTVDPAFVELGKAYAPKLSATYAETWRTMADRIARDGAPIGVAVQQFEADWRDRRGQLFEAQLAGPFRALIPEGASEDQITAAQRAAYAAACRGVAEGLLQ